MKEKRMAKKTKNEKHHDTTESRRDARENDDCRLMCDKIKEQKVPLLPSWEQTNYKVVLLFRLPPF